MGRRFRKLALSGLMAGAMTVGLAGTAHATITNDPGTHHIKNWDSSQCLMFNPDENNILRQYRCLNAQSEEFTFIGIGPSGGAYNVLLKNYWTGLCMGVAQTPLNGGRIYGLPCDGNDPRQYWHFESLGGKLSDWSQVHAALGDNLCLDKDQGNDTEDLPIQVWTCANPSPNFPPGADQHKEQWWSEV
jgi:hypothetical protein